MAVESPKFTLEKRDGKFEIRSYEAYILAQVEVDADFTGSINEGFNILAGYIFGRNQSRQRVPMGAPVSEEKLTMAAPVTSEKIPMAAPVTSEEIPMTTPIHQVKLPMTAPVSEEKAAPGRYRISFVMPSSYTLETLPIPLDSRISFRLMPGHRAAAYTFSGWLVSERKALDKTRELKAWMAREGLKAKGEFVVAQYNSPWVPGPLRHNEIIVEVE